MKKQKPKHDPGENPQYNHFKAHYRSTSAVLNPGRSPLNAEMWGMSDKKSLLGLQAQYEGKLENCLGLVEGVGEAFEEAKLRCRRQGKREPTELTPELAEMKYKYEAWADVLLEEIARIKELLSKFLAREKQEAEDRILQYGPDGASRGEPAKEIDGQPCIVDKDGYPVIACPKSPYDGMKVVDYREFVSRPWIKARSDAATLAREKAGDVALTKAERDSWWVKSQRLGRAVPVPWDELPGRPEGY